MDSNRRRFLGGAIQAGAAAVCAVPLRSLAQEAEPLPIIDTHQHLWDLERFELPWVASPDAPAVLKKSYVTRDYLEATRGVNVVKAVYMEVDVPPDLQVKEAEHVIALSRSPDHPTVAAVISGRPASEDFGKYIRRFQNTREVVGVRQVLQVPETPQGYCLGDPFVESIRLLGELGKSFDICIRPAELGDAVKFVDRCPDTRFVLDHCGNADPNAWLPEDRREGQEPWHQVAPWQSDIESLAKCENVVCKISGLIARAPRENWKAEDLAPAINFCLDAFGPDRVMFGGDWPVCKLTASYREWVGALKQIVASRSRDEQNKLFHDNAQRWYGLA